MNRFDLEEKLQQIDNIEAELDLLLYAVGDSPKVSTEDDLMNMIIGMQAMHRKRYEQLWNCFESLVKAKVITSDNASLEECD
ncbi:hypothetical protein OAU81_00550 [bacterium]|nr:hypothetical protein [bacterium]